MGLNEFRRTLYVDDCKVATGATTFDLHNEFLIYTTDSHECHFLRTSSISVVATSDPSGMWNDCVFCRFHSRFTGMECRQTQSSRGGKEKGGAGVKDRCRGSP